MPDRTSTYTWTRTKIDTTERKYTDIRSRKDRSELALEPNSGRVAGQVTMLNESDYAIDVDVSNVRIAVVAFSPFTGVKLALGDVSLLNQTFLLGYGSGNNSASSFVELPGLNSFDMLNRLSEGWVFDMEMASFNATDHANGNNVGALISRVNQRNARISVHYGDTTTRQFGQVSLYQPGNNCLTSKDLLQTYVGAANVEFDRMTDGTLIVKRINHRTNRFADRDFDTLTPEEQAQYGRWVVGFQYYNQPLTGLDLETTRLASEDKVYFYYLTAKDLAPPPPLPDVTLTYTVANDGSSPSSQLVTPVSTYDTVEVRVANAFQIEEIVTSSAGTVSTSCGIIYRATRYARSVKTDSTLHNITIPNIDWYGLQLDFGGTGSRTLASVLADPAARGSITTFRGFPYYDFTVRFLVTPAMLGSYPTRNLILRSTNPRQTLSVGYEGFDVAGRRKTCRSNQLAGYYRNTATTKNWRKLDNIDGDLDEFYDTAKTGIDFDDLGARRFPFAPEHLDGIDNNGDIAIDNSPLRCPVGLQSNASGTCTLDNRTGWYPPSPNISMERRWKRSDGSFTAWEPAGSGLTSYTFSMSSDPAVVAMEIKTTYVPQTGGSFSGINSVNHLSGAEVPTFGVGIDVEAEAGRSVIPMRADSIGLDTFVHVPKGTPVFNAAAVDFKFNVTSASDYVLWTRIEAFDSSDDSFLVTVYDPTGAPVVFGYGATAAHFRLETASPAYPYATFSWTQVNHWNPYNTPSEYLNPVVYHLVPGVYQVQVRPREQGTRLDKIRLSYYCPDLDQDGYTTCAGDCNDSNWGVHPNRNDICSNSVDDDCDGYIDEGCGGSGSPIFEKDPPLEDPLVP